MKVKNLLAKMLFNKKQRMIIYKSLVYSAYKYRQYGNVDKAVEVQVVLNEISGKLGIVPETFTREQVDNIVNEINKKAQRAEENAYLAGIYEGKKNCVNDNENKSIDGVLAVGTVINVDKCEKCEGKDNCMLYKAISEVEIEDSQEQKDGQEDKTEDKEEEVNSTSSETTPKSEDSDK